MPSSSLASGAYLDKSELARGLPPARPRSTKLLLVRADASAEIGTGHVMRCLALGQAWVDAGGRVAFVTGKLSPSLARRLDEEGMIRRSIGGEPGSPADAAACLADARALGADWIVLDGYRFGAAYRDALSAGGFPLALVDDDGTTPVRGGDLILNQNLHADEIAYDERSPQTIVLRGTRYALLRREFRQWRGPARSYPDEACKLLMLLGGSDPHDHTSRLLEIVLALATPAFFVTVLVGPANPRADAILRRFGDGGGRLRLLRNVADVTEMMRTADMALSSAGSAVWELAMFGTPMILGAVAPVEELLASRLARAEGCLYGGAFETLGREELIAALTRLARDRGLRMALGQKAAALVDGQGAARVVAAMRRGSDAARESRGEA